VFGNAVSRHNRSKQSDDSMEAIDIEELDHDSSVSSTGPGKGLSGLGSAFRQVSTRLSISVQLFSDYF
jgi:hypothetical protein